MTNAAHAQAPRAYDIPAFKRAIEGIRTEEHPKLVQQKSRDFYWYSPILKRQLDDVTGDIVVAPRSEDQVIRVLAAAYAEDIPVTVRGSGTGNYGQAMPLAGGVVLDVTGLAEIEAIDPGAVAVGAGAILARIDEATRRDLSMELRMHPSTYKTASIGGFVAGGSGGVGSINWGGLRDLGNVLRLRVVTMEADPRTLDLHGEDLHKAIHAYGVNGVITKVEMPLTAAYDWIDVLVGFDGPEGFVDAARYGDTLGRQDGILTKNIAPIAAPIPHAYFKRHQRFVSSPETSVCAVMVAPHAIDAFLTLTAREKGTILYRGDTASDEESRGLPPVYELAWNHTTLRALRVDPAITYLQVLYPYPDHLAKVARMAEIFAGAEDVPEVVPEVMGHLEFVRFDGNVLCFGLPLVRFTTEERLDEIVAIFEGEGCPVFNPHRYTLEEGGMKRTDAVQLAFKREADPKGLLNPGKMIAWDRPDFDFSGQTYLFPGLAAS